MKKTKPTVVKTPISTIYDLQFYIKVTSSVAQDTFAASHIKHVKWTHIDFGMETSSQGLDKKINVDA